VFFVGIDLAKSKFDVALIADSAEPQTPKRKVLQNNNSGFTKLLTWMDRRATGEIHVCMEATGTYFEDLATFLVSHNIKVSVVNPSCIASYARSCSLRNKTDAADAYVIADYARAKHPSPWTPPSPASKELRELMRRLSALEQSRQDEQNRLTAGVSSAVVRSSIKKSIQFLDKQIKQLQELIRQHIDSDPGLREDLELLVSIVGIGEKTAATILGELPDHSNFRSAKQVSAYAGACPRQYQSGSSVRGRTHMCKIGNGRLRRALYFPAMVAAQHNPIVKDLYERLIAAGKNKKCALGAAMRKLLHIIFGVLRTRRAFDPCFRAA